VAAERAKVALDEPLLDCAAAAALLNFRVSWVRDAARLGQLPCLRVGRHLRFTRVMLEEWLAGQFAERPGASRAYRRPTGGQVGGSGLETRRVAFRPRTEAALLASLAEQPKRKVERWVVVIPGRELTVGRQRIDRVRVPCDGLIDGDLEGLEPIVCEHCADGCAAPADVGAAALQSSADWSRASCERLNSKAHLLEGRAIGFRIPMFWECFAGIVRRIIVQAARSR
jgi:excisionase family DNA binding protein